MGLVTLIRAARDSEDEVVFVIRRSTSLGWRLPVRLVIGGW